MTSDRKKPGVAFGATVASAVVLIYIASFGPVCWLAEAHFSYRNLKPLRQFYWPLARIAHTNQTCLALLTRYGQWMSPSNLPYSDYIVIHGSPGFD